MLRTAIVVPEDTLDPHCPASDSTLTDRFADAVRARAPQLRAVRPVDRSVDRGPLRRLLPLLP